MEKKNTVLLTVIAVATLLVAVVGATFAYFTATTEGDTNAGGTSNVNTAEVASVKVTTAAVEGTSHVYYPGTKNAVGQTVAATVEGNATTAAAYTVTYTVSGSITLDKALSADSTISWKLYEAPAAVTSPVTCPEVSQETVDGEVRYTRICTEDTANLGTVVDSGTIDSATGLTDAVEATGLTIDTGVTKYYYLVVTFENNENASQNADQNINIVAQLDAVAVTNTVQK